tara:strand:+ start:434 stop:772 length:339 start_codon:yes stop_codon:yes gene_type:complete
MINLKLVDKIQKDILLEINTPTSNIKDLYLSQINAAKKEIKYLGDELNIYNPVHWLKIIYREDLINEWKNIKLNCERFLQTADKSDRTNKALIKVIRKLENDLVEMINIKNK